MAIAAQELERRELLRLYCAPAAITPGQEERLARLPKPVGSALRSQLGRRRVPDGLPLRRVASGFEVASVLAGRAAPSSRIRRLAADARDLRFDIGVSRLIERGDTDAYLTYGASLRTIRRGIELGVRTFVEQALHHHRFIASILQEEARLQPAWAGTLQFHQPNVRRRGLLDAELAAARRTVVLSNFSKQTYVDAGVRAEDIDVIQLGVSPKAFADVKRQDDNTFRVLFLGVLTQRKGLSYLVEGFRRAGIPDSELLLAGQPWGRGEPWRSVPGVRQVPWVSRESLNEVFSTADVLVLPSLAEGFARVTLEAMAAGIPAIVTPNSGGADAVRDGIDGYVVPIRDPDSIAERLRRLSDDGNHRREMGRSARARAAEFSWDRYGASVAEAVIGDA
jgi:glycosyltransferase involved in cell wall biosynthesis